MRTTGSAAMLRDALSGDLLLERASLLYLVLPILIFFIGWLRLVIALPAAALLLIGVAQAMRGPRLEEEGSAKPPAPSSPSAARKAVTYTTLLAVIALIVMYSGVGLVTENQAHFRHDAFVRDLTEFPWPLGYSQTGTDGKARMLAFYLANSLTPGLVGKAFGWVAANVFSIVWGVLGVFLAVCLFILVIGRVSLLYGLLFLSFGGLDLLGCLAFQDSPFRLGIPAQWMVSFARSPTGREVMGGVFWITPGAVSILYSCPQHAFACWLSLLLILRDCLAKRSCGRAVFLWSCTLLWSPFTFVGLAPFVLVPVLATRGRGLLSFANAVTSLVVLVPTALFLASNNQQYPSGFLWEYQDILRSWPMLVLFYLLSFGIYLVVCPTHDRSGSNTLQPLWGWVTVAVLLALPWYHLGEYNDLATKASIPAYLVLLVLLATAIRDARTEVQRRSARILVAFLVLGAFNAATRVTRAIDGGGDFELIPIERVVHVDGFQTRDKGALVLAEPDTFFWKYLAKPAQMQ